jgi:hypothetical protein
VIELQGQRLVFTFPEVHPDARLEIDFQRTLRIPDDNNTYPLPPGLGSFPLVHVDDHARKVPRRWLEHGGVMLPMYQAEAMWLLFAPGSAGGYGPAYPFAIKVAAGKINAVTGDAWADGLHGDPQDYLIAPTQPWLDGYCVEKGVIRQFVAMPLGAGYTAEEQITRQAEHGGLQIAVYPMKREAYERRLAEQDPYLTAERGGGFWACEMEALDAESPDMGLAPGGRMQQEIYDDAFGLEDWDVSHGSRCFVHIVNSQAWEAITGQRPPTLPPTAKQYTDAGLPWFDYYDERATAVPGAPVLKDLKSVAEVGKQKRQQPLPENEPVTPELIIKLRAGLKKGQVREGAF